MWETLIARVRHLASSRRWRVARNGVLAGLLAGAVVCLYRYLIEIATGFAVQTYAYLGEHPWMIPVWGVAAAVVVVGVWLVLRWEPQASGSGIPQVKGFLLGGLGMRPGRVIGARFLGGTSGAVFGLSLGREGPSIHLGAAVAALLRRPLRATPEEADHLVTSGAAAGLAAAFNAPVSGMIFGMEGLHRSFSPLVVASASTGALAAGAVSPLVFGPHPILQFAAVDPLPLTELWLLLLLGIITGVLGAAVNRLLLASQTLAHLPGPTGLGVAFGAALLVGLTMPQVLGGGAPLIGWAEQASAGIGVLLILLAGKMLFTAISFGSGIPGGIFMPILAMGTLCGASYAVVLRTWGISPASQAIVALCGMAGLLAATVRTPLTSILLTAEMSGSLSHLLPVALVVIIAAFTADALRVPPIYEALLERRLRAENAAAAS
ncbi:ClC family H(+)/Cl(-) exchange transporter [Propioniciclava flava]